ncbi:MAG: DUF3078 domain-containing protein [Alistipes sp.]|nr:DUF3078 domain-containing protein [Alistipes sp.]
MKRFFTLFATLIACAGIASAQATVESATPQEQVTFSNEIKTDEQKLEISNEAKRKAERKAILKERNTIEFNASLNGSLSHFNNSWQTVNGTTNTITGVANILFTHQFKKDKFVIDSKVTGKIGYTYNFFDKDAGKENSVTKSQDEWFISTSPAYKMSKSWNVGGTLSLRSQFANGTKKGDLPSSEIFAPAYLIASVGFTYVCPKKQFPIKINLAPLSLNATFVTSSAVRSYYFAEKGFKDANGNAVTYEQFLADKTILNKDQINSPYAFGLTLENGSGRYEGGSSVQIDFDRTFGKKGVFRYRTTLYSFYGWINETAQQIASRKTGVEYEHIAPTVRWENTIDIKATKYFSTQLYFQLYYNKAQIKKVQTQTVLGVGLSYTFKNK